MARSSAPAPSRPTVSSNSAQHRSSAPNSEALVAVARLSGAWILEILRTTYPDGVLRGALLEQFASILVTPRSSRGAKGRVARRLYVRLDRLQRKGAILQFEGIIRLAGLAEKPAKTPAMPVLGPILRKKQFLALMVEDRNEEGPKSTQLRAARWEFLASAVEAGWTVAQAAIALGITTATATAIIAVPKRAGGA